MDSDIRQCYNCNCTIGRLEQSHIWQDHEVCKECHDRLRGGRQLVSEQTDLPDSAAPAPLKPAAEKEETIWEGTSSQATNMGTYLSCALIGIILLALAIWVYAEGWRVFGFLLGSLLIIPLFISARKWLQIKYKKYTITTERIRITTGILTKHVEELELYRVKDTTYVQTLPMRMFKLGHIVLITSDRSTPTLVIKAVPKALELRENIRQAVEIRRDLKRVREVDFE